MLIELQNDFCYEDRVLYGAVKDQPATQGSAKNTVDLVGKAREKGVLIVHVPISFTKDHHELKGPVGILKRVVEGKRMLSSFPSTNLDFILRSRGIRNTAICGFLTNICVESTARDAYDKTYSVIILKDCTYATSSEDKIFPALGEVMTHEEFLEKLEY